MLVADFINGKSGKLVQTARGYLAYVPNPLEPGIEMALPIVKELSLADRALCELAGVARTLPNPHLLIGPFLRREAVLSSRIEGTHASFSDLLFLKRRGCEKRKSLMFAKYPTTSRRSSTALPGFQPCPCRFG